jgi:hypothetical protein
MKTPLTTSQNVNSFIQKFKDTFQLGSVFFLFKGPFFSKSIFVSDGVVLRIIILSKRM